MSDVSLGTFLIGPGAIAPGEIGSHWQARARGGSDSEWGILGSRQPETSFLSKLLPRAFGF